MKEWLIFLTPPTIHFQLTLPSGFPQHQKLELTGGLAYCPHRISLSALSLDSGKALRLELLVSSWGLAWFITGSLDTHPSTLSGRQNQDGEKCSHKAIRHSLLLLLLWRKISPNLVCIINVSQSKTRPRTHGS